MQQIVIKTEWQKRRFIEWLMSDNKTAYAGKDYPEKGGEVDNAKR